MSILIKGMEMPKEDTKVLMIFPDGNVRIWGTDIDADKWAEAIEVSTPHGRLGDLDKLEQMFVDIDNAPYSAFDGEEPFYTAEDAAQIIRLAPTIIEADGKDINVTAKEDGT